MSVTIKLTFPAGRYHATPWGKHVNEGAVEWPPSPWRLLRALVAVWKRTCPDDFTEEQVKRALGPLTDPPLFHLPPHKVAHTRHYMPWEKKGPQDRTLVFDTFVSLSRKEAVTVGWPNAKLAVEDECCLKRLVENLTSLGRAEGWVIAELLSFPESTPSVWNCQPAATDSNPVPVLCADPASVFGSEHYPTLDAKKLAKGKVNPSEFLFDCPRWHLCLDTETIHQERWPSVPGSKWVNYTRPGESPAGAAKKDSATLAQPTVARFLLDGPVLPLVTDTIRVAEAFRHALMSRFRTWCEKHSDQAAAFRRTDAPEQFSSPTFAGKELSGAMRTDHRHAFYLPTADNTNDPRRITHVTVIAADGFAAGELAALNAIRKLTVNESNYRVQLIGLGQPEDFTHWLFQTSAVWESVTPFVAHRHLKRSGQKRDRLPLTDTDPRQAFVRMAAQEILARTGVAMPEVTPAEKATIPAIDFRRHRDRPYEQRHSRPFAHLRLTFPQPVPRPAIFGYGCHYGLGLLRPRSEIAAGR